MIPSSQTGGRSTPSPSPPSSTLHHISPPPKKRRPITSSGSPTHPHHHHNLNTSSGPPSSTPPRQEGGGNNPPVLESSTLAAALTKPLGGREVTFVRQPPAPPPGGKAPSLPPLPTGAEVLKVKQEEGECGLTDGVEDAVPPPHLQAVNLVMEGSILRQRIQGYQGSPDAPLPPAVPPTAMSSSSSSSSNSSSNSSGTGTSSARPPPPPALLQPAPPHRTDEDSAEDSYPGVECGGEVGGDLAMIGGETAGGAGDKEAMATSPMVIRQPLIGLLPRDAPGNYIS